MPYANIQATLSDADLLDICNHLDQSKAKLPFLVNLTMKERKQIARHGAMVKAFNKKVLLYSKHNPGLVPNYVDINGTNADQELHDKLKNIKMRIDILSDALLSTILALENEIYSSTRVVYRSIENATQQNVPGSSEIYNDLKQHFSRTGKKKKIEKVKEQG